ncbi:hypothetical protein Syun_027517 [Stephania yunnanensis]|uniref:Uncharacterized protein n=1 Tax=Stephania yunnanensis TaxID=152371 RepID=A0AAP0EFT7_9MAGN
MEAASPKYFIEKHFLNKDLTLCKIGMSFLMSNISSTYSTRKTTTLPLTFLYTQGSSSFFMKSNSLIASTKRIFQLREACFNP